MKKIYSLTNTGGFVRIRFTVMKKSLILIAVLSVCLLFSACSKENRLLPYVSELTENVYYGESEHYSLRGKSGFIEKERAHDGKKSALRDELVLTLLSETAEEAEIIAEITVDGTVMTEKFELNPATFAMNAVFEYRPEVSEFEVTISQNGEKETVTMKSALPENTLTLSGALDALYANQKALVDGYMQNNVFNGEIRAKVLLRNGKAYWYIGLIDTSGRTHALLIDGASGEILAAKDVF